jgi:putative ABC transport system substrate-binding protein
MARRDRQAAKQATTTIPIVMAVVGNPEEIGLVQSLARPGGNITGSSFMFAEVNAKRVQVLKDAVWPAPVAALYNPDNFSHVSVLAAMEPMSRSLRLVLHPVQVRQADDGAALRGSSSRQTASWSSTTAC